MTMTLEERENFKRKARAYYGADEPLQEPGIGEPWRDIVRDYKEMATSRYRPPTDQLSPHANYRGMTVNPEAFSYGDPLGLLSSTEDMDEVLGNVDYRAQLKAMDPEGRDLMGNEPLRPSFKDMMRTDGVPIGPQLGEVSAMDQSLYFGGGHPDELSLSQAPQHYGYDQFTRKLPGLLDSGEQFSQAFPGPEPEGDLMEQARINRSAGPLAETSPEEGGKWESDPRFRDALARYMMQIGRDYSRTDPFYLD